MSSKSHMASRTGLRHPPRDIDESAHFQDDSESASILFSTAALHEDKNVMDPMHGLPVGMMFSPFVKLRPSPPRIKTEPITCQKCLAFINPFCQVKQATSEWSCSFCGEINSNPELAGESLETRLPQTSHRAVEHMSAVPAVNQTYPQSVLFLVDITIPKVQLHQLVNTVKSSVKLLPKEANVGLICFGKNVNIYELGSVNRISYDTFSGTFDPKQAEINSIFNHESHSKYPYVAPLFKCEEMLFKCLEYAVAEQPDEKAIPQVFPASRRRTRMRSTEKLPRCTGTALYHAINILSRQSNPDPSLPICRRIVTCTCGPMNQGVGAGDTENAQEARKRIGTHASLRGIALDVFCVGHEAFQVQKLQDIIWSGGGSVIVQPDFEQHFEHNLSLLFKRTIPLNVKVTIRVSQEMVVSRIIGPIPPQSPEQKPAKVPYVTPGDVIRSPKNTYEFLMSRQDPDLGLAVFFDVIDNIKSKHVLVQVTAEMYDNPLNPTGRRTRISTRKIGVTSDMNSYFQAIDDEVTAVLIAKKATVLASLPEEDNHEMALRAIDVPIQRLSDRIRDMGMQRLPETLGGLPLKLFHIRRGPLLSGLLQHPDDKTGIRCLFLRTNFLESLRIVCPRLLALHNPPADVSESGNASSNDDMSSTPSPHSPIEAIGSSNSTPHSAPEHIVPDSIKPPPTGTSDIENKTETIESTENIKDKEEQVAVETDKEKQEEEKKEENEESEHKEKQDNGDNDNDNEEKNTIEENMKVMNVSEEGKSIEKINDDNTEQKNENVDEINQEKKEESETEKEKKQATDDDEPLNPLTQKPSVPPANLLRLVSVPLETLSLFSDSILILDHCTHVYIWSGHFVKGNEFDGLRAACVRFVHKLTHNRFPAPVIISFNENSSAARSLLCRLIPAHKDPIKSHIRSHPRLLEMKPSDQLKHAEKFMVTNDPSFLDYYSFLFPDMNIEME